MTHDQLFRLMLLPFLIVPLFYSSCSQPNINGTELGDPMVEMAVNPFNNIDGVSLSVCISKVKLVYEDANVQPVTITMPSQTFVLQSSGTDLTTIKIPKGTYVRTEIELQSSCSSGYSARVVNASGDFATADSLTVRFDGYVQMSHGYFRLGLNPQNLIDAMGTAASSSEVSTLASQVRGSFAAEPVPFTAAVESAYPLAGANWNDYVKNNNTSLSEYRQPDEACDVSVAGYYYKCVHGGETRKVVLPDYSSCLGLTISDKLNAFEWECDDQGSIVTFFSKGLKSGKGLATLLDENGWKQNQISILNGTNLVAKSAPAIWWSNPIRPLPSNSSTGVVQLDNGSDTVGRIYVLTATRSSNGYNLNADKISLVTLAGATLNYAGSAAQNCNSSTGEVSSANGICLVAVGNQHFTWVEGSFDGSQGATQTDVVLGLYNGTSFSRFQNLTIESGDGPTFMTDTAVNLAYDVRSNLFANVIASSNPANTQAVGLILQRNANFNTFSTVHLSDFRYSNGGGVLITLASSYNNFSDITSTGNGRGIMLTGAGTDYNSFTDITLTNNFEGGLYTNDASGNVFRNLHVANNAVSGFGGGLGFEDGIGNQVFNAVIAQNSSGITLNRAVRTIVHGANISTCGRGIYVVGDAAVDNSLSEVVINNSYRAIDIDNANRNIVSQVTIMNSEETGITIQNGADQNTFNNVVVGNSPSGIAFTTAASSNNTFSQLAVSNNDTGVNLSNLSNNSKFTGFLLVGNNGAQACTMTGGTNPGLVDLTCTNAGTDGSNTYTGGFVSDAVLRTGRTVATTFVGKINTTDILNASDSNFGTAPFPADASAYDWVRFSNSFRSWGRSGSVFPNADQRSLWNSAVGSIWDWQLVVSDTTLRARSGDGASANGAFSIGASCPAAIQGNRVASDLQSTPNTFLLNAVEIVDILATGYSANGDHDGLCESNESCLYMPNFGAYQGHGGLGTCTFSSGTVTNVTVYGYLFNGI